MRVLDIDTDFFMHDVAHWRGPDDERLDDDEYPVWTVAEAMAFLTDRCLLDGPRPGFVVERHHELFGLWRDAIATGHMSKSFHVTHVDAHADLGLGDAGYVYLCGELLLREPDERTQPRVDETGLAEGNFLAFAAACRWLTDLTYVHNDAGGDDLLVFHMENFDPDATHLELKAMAADDIMDVLMRHDGTWPVALRVEPKVPFRKLIWSDFRATQPFDIVCLSHSPEFTPPAADEIFSTIAERFITPMEA